MSQDHIVKVILKEQNLALIQKWPSGKGREQHLSPDQMLEMGEDSEATWVAREADGIWWLRARLTRQADDALSRVRE